MGNNDIEVLFNSLYTDIKLNRDRFGKELSEVNGFWKTFYLHLFVNIFIFIYTCVLFVSIMWVKRTLKEKVPFLPYSQDRQIFLFSLLT